MEQFIYVIRPKKANFMETMTKEESEIMGQHFQYLKGLLDEGTLILAGPCLDAAFGVVILQTDSMDTARSIMENDPAVMNGVMSSELRPFRVSLINNKL